MAPQVGLEPTTLRLTAGCSAIELLRSVAAGLTANLDFIIIASWMFLQNSVRARSDTLSLVLHFEVGMAGGRSVLFLFLSLSSFVMRRRFMPGTPNPLRLRVTQFRRPPVAEIKPWSISITAPRSSTIIAGSRTAILLRRRSGLRRRCPIRARSRSAAGTRRHPQAADRVAFDRQHHVPRCSRGKYYFYTKREGMQNQPSLCTGRTRTGPTACLSTPTNCAADGTIALDWFQPSDSGKYVAYGTSPSGSEMSTLHVIETKTGTILPDTIERTRAASIAWLHDNSGFYYTRYPKKGDVPAGRRCTTAMSSFICSAAHLVTDDPIFGEGRDPEDWPSVLLSNDGRWLLIHVSQGWTKSELFLMDHEVEESSRRA